MTTPTTQTGGTISNPVLVPITVTASSVLNFTQNFNIAVYSAPVCVLDVTVRDAVSGNPLNGATIALDYTDKQYFTGPTGKPIDNNGNAVTIYAPSGSHAVFAIAKNYLPVSLSTDCSAPVELDLQPGQALQVSAVTVTQLTQAQIIARGVNLTDPANYNVFDFVLSLRIGPLPVPNVQLPSTPVTPGTCVCQTFPIGGGFGGYAGGGSVTLSAYYPTPDPTIHVDTWIIIPGDIRVLKQFFDATVFIQNNTSFPINNVNASLTLPPSGLSLPDLFNTSQSLSQSLGTIPAQGKTQASWVLRGDLPGTYAVTGTANGTLQPPGGGSPIALTSSLTSGNFTVTAPKIGVAFGTPKVVYAGVDFPITITITNQCAIDLNGVRVHIKTNKLVNCKLSTNQTDPTDPADATMFLVGEIPIGESRTVTIYFTSLVTGIVEEVQSYVSDPFLEPPVTVTPKPILPPVAKNDILNTPVNTPYTINVLANDSDGNSPALPLTLTAFTQPAHGTVSKNADNTLTYVPNTGYIGADNFTYTISNGNATATATVSAHVRAPRTISGVVLLEEVFVSGQTVTLQFRSTDGGTLQTQTATLGAGGAFSVSNVPSGTYRLAIKGDKWLQAVTPIDANAADVANVKATLLAGDGNNDNSVDSSDFTLLIGAFNSDVTIPGSGYDPRADFNDDGSVDSTDFTLLIGNFGQRGAN